jgi:DNA polymerase III subunit epsilon
VRQPLPFASPYLDVPTCWSDCESTGLRPGIDQACQVAVARFEGGVCVASIGSLIDPGIVIPDEAVAIHSITTDMVEGAPTLRQFFERADVQQLVEGAQPGAYHATYDRALLPAWVWPMDWPFLDALVAVRVVDRFAKGKGRHKLPAVCERHGITIAKAHDAESDARAAGEVFYKLMPQALAMHTEFGNQACLGAVLHWTRVQEANAWHSFHRWLSEQPPLPESP